jgi:hypothetical protein
VHEARDPRRHHRGPRLFHQRELPFAQLDSAVIPGAFNSEASRSYRPAIWRSFVAWSCPGFVDTHAQ